MENTLRMILCYMSVIRSSKDFWNLECARPVPAVPVNKYSLQHSLSLPLLVLFILCQLLLEFPLHREPTSSIALLLTANQASAFNFALKAPRRRLPVISQCPNLVGTFQFSSTLQRTLFDQLKLNQTHCRA